MHSGIKLNFSVEEPIRTGVSPTNVPESISLSTHGRGKGRPGRKPGRRPGPKTKFVPFPNQAPSTTDKPKTDEVIKDEPNNEENNQSETESADRYVDFCPIQIYLKSIKIVLILYY